MAFKLKIRDEEIDIQQDRSGMSMARYEHGNMQRGGHYQHSSYEHESEYVHPTVMRNQVTPDRYVTRSETVNTNDPLVNLSNMAAKKGFNVPPVAMAAIGGAVAWGMFQQMVIAGAIAAGAYLFTSMGKNKGGGDGGAQGGQR